MLKKALNQTINDAPGACAKCSFQYCSTYLQLYLTIAEALSSEHFDSGQYPFDRIPVFLFQTKWTICLVLKVSAIEKYDCSKFVHFILIL